MTLPLRVRGVVKRYGSRVILGGVQLDVGPGELVVLRGPNGTGKSTLIGCVTGQVVPDEGTIAIAGHDLRGAPLEARRQLRQHEIDVGHAAATELKPVGAHTGWNTSPLVSLGKKYVVF